ncbi:MAG TPA: hypothetical protein VFO03_11150 [Gaiellaceae bacterium]|nr:hypothetical protein [Gaiellaceae bacterium]
MRRTHALLNVARLVAQVRERVLGPHRGSVVVRTAPPCVAVPAMARTTEGEIPSLARLPRGAVKTIRDGRAVLSVNLQ